MTNVNLKDFVENISYKKDQTYTKEEILSEILSEISKIELLNVVQSLPISNIEENKIYLVLNGDESEHNNYDLFVYVNDDWEQLDKFDFSLGDVPTRAEVEYLLSEKTDAVHGHDNATSLLDGFMPKEDKAKLDNIEPEATKNVASDSIPLTDGTGSAGIVDDYSRADHVHPTDTSRAEAVHTHSYANITGTPDLTNYIQKSQTPGLVTNDGTIDTTDYVTQAELDSIELNGGGGGSVDLTNYLQKSVVQGLVKNDGTIDTNEYLNANFGYIDDDLKLHFVIALLDLTINDTIIQSGETADIQATLQDSNGNKIENETVYFFERIES